MKKLLWLLTVLAALVGGFFIGKYYEAHRELDSDDVQHFRKRVAERAGDWADEVGDKLEKVLGGD